MPGCVRPSPAQPLELASLCLYHLMGSYLEQGVKRAKPVRCLFKQAAIPEAVFKKRLSSRTRACYSCGLSREQDGGKKAALVWLVLSPTGL